jgi:hypothetical protein
MDTWIWKNGRPDHMDGCHDDSLTCLSMALFVIQFYVIKNDKEKSKSHAILKSFRINNLGRDTTHKSDLTNEPISNINININVNMPFYSSQSIEKKRQQQLTAMLLLTGFKKRK